MCLFKEIKDIILKATLHRAREMAQSVNLLFKCEDLSPGPQHSCNKPGTAMVPVLDMQGRDGHVPKAGQPATSELQLQ